jgi:hypothetical protein
MLMVRVLNVPWHKIEGMLQRSTQAYNKTFYIYKHKKENLSCYMRRREDKMLKKMGFKFVQELHLQEQSKKPTLYLVK